MQYFPQDAATAVDAREGSNTKRGQVMTAETWAQVLDAILDNVAVELDAALERARDYLQCVPCTPFCSRNAKTNGAHVNYCAQSVANEPGFASAIRGEAAARSSTEGAPA